MKKRVAMAKQRHGKMRHIWSSNEIHTKLKLRLYVASVCSIMTYGSEAWYIDDEVGRVLNGANSLMVSKITGRSPHEEAKPQTRTFDLVKSIRARRLQWLGHILRMKLNPDGTERLIKSAVRHMYLNPKKGDLLMDAPNVASWRELCMWADDRDKWRTRVRALRAPKIGVTTSIGHHVVLASDFTFSIST